MTRPSAADEKPLFWIGSALKEVTRFPADVQRSIGFALSAAQYGGSTLSQAVEGRRTGDGGC